MSIERIIKIMLMDLSSDNLKLEEELEKVINSDMEINEKTKSIKSILTNMVSTDASIAKLTTMFSNNKTE